MTASSSRRLYTRSGSRTRCTLRRSSGGRTVVSVSTLLATLLRVPPTPPPAAAAGLAPSLAMTSPIDRAVHGVGVDVVSTFATGSAS